MSLVAAVLAASWLSLQPPHDAGLELSWHAADGCPDTDTVHARLRASLDDPDASVIVHATASRGDDGRWRMLLQVEGPGGRGARELDGDSCEALVDAAAVVVAIVARGEATPHEQPEIAPEPTPPPESTPQPAVVPAPIVAPTEPRHRLPGWHIGAAGAFDAAILPRVGATISAEVGPAWPRVIAALGVTHAIARTRRVPGAAGRYSLWAATIRGGPRLQRERFAIAGLVGAELGALLADGLETTIKYERTHLWAAFTAAAEIGWRFTPRWTAALSLGMAVPMRRFDFVAADIDLGSIGRIGVRAGVRIAYERRGRLRNPRSGGQP